MLKIHHLRNATMLIETKSAVLLIDPMLGDKGSLPSFSERRFKSQKNPIVSLPEHSNQLLQKVTYCLITHKHEDHLDGSGIKFLKENNIPVICSIKDKDRFSAHDLKITQTIDYWNKEDFLDGSIEGIPATHGYGKVAELMGDVMGYFIAFKNKKSVYLSSDTIYTEAVDKVLKSYKPDISVLACGSAQLDEYEPILMTMEDIIKFVKNATGLVMANHLEALNHCPTTRKELKDRLEEEDLLNKVWIPEDGETFEIY